MPSPQTRLKQRTQFIENIKAKHKAMGRPITDRQATKLYERAVEDRAGGGADVNKDVSKATKKAAAARGPQARRARNSDRESILGLKKRTKKA